MFFGMPSSFRTGFDFNELRKLAMIAVGLELFFLLGLYLFLVMETFLVRKVERFGCGKGGLSEKSDENFLLILFF